MKKAMNELQQELLAAGAKPQEVSGLVHIAHHLRQLSTKPHTTIWQRIHPSVFIATSAIALLAIVVFLSQSALPQTFLYPVQKTSDTIAVFIDPSYKGHVMMKRAEQVQVLVLQHASSQTVITALVDYKIAAQSYIAPSSGVKYTVFEYCKKMLEAAEAAAPTSTKQAITETLTSLNT